ncbi:MAG TPA: YbdK family carboxylate-amine ligase [Thermoleophilaceae bacterium]|nr:YbdK family carboxylate-amine ligase [Thermoleophilaceae bacterium]
MPPARPATADELRDAFSRAPELTVGLEEELMLLDPETLDLVPRAGEVLERVAGDPAFKPEMPASQLEIVTPPRATVGEAIGDLADGRARLLETAGDLARPAAAGAHPFAAPEGELNPGERYARMVDEYGDVARRQLVCAFQVHVAVGDADGTLAVYNALRGRLPEIAALAAAAPFHAGRDSGLASVRPTISQMLPRQGVPPPIPSWEAFAGELRWGAEAGAVPEPRRWWWELRPNPAFGTLEVRVPDAQAALADAAGVAAFVHALVGWLHERHAAGERLPVPETWRIEENGWSACRHGVEGTLADLDTGRRVPTRERLHELLYPLEPVAVRLGCAPELREARRLVEENGALGQRRVAADGGPHEVARWLCRRFAELGAPATGSG